MKTVFLTIARVLFDKGYRELVEASKIIRSRHHGVEFQWLGGMDEGYPEYVSAKQIISDQDSGYIKYFGYKPHVQKYINKATCIILPSYHEGMSRTLMEALAMGKPIITTDIAGCRETVDEGKNGFLCKPKDTLSLVEAIEKFLTLTLEEKKNMGLYSRQKAEAQFNMEDVKQVYEDILFNYFNRAKQENIESII